MTRVMAALLLLIMAIGCSSPGPPEKEPLSATEQFDATLDATFALESFRIVITADGELSGSADFVAPDSARRVFGSADEGIETISIGNVAWFSIPERPGYYVEAEGDVEDVLRPLVDVMLPLVVARHATDVARAGPGAFSFSSELAGRSLTGTAAVTDGLIQSITLSGLLDGVENLTYRFTAYNSGRAVEAPPADRIVEEPGLPPCPEDFVALEICAQPKETTS